MLVAAMLPTAYGLEVSGDSTTATGKTVSETISETTVSTMPEDEADVSQPPPDETEPTTTTNSTVPVDSTEAAGTDFTEGATVPEDETQPEEVLEEPVIVTDEYDIMALASTQNSIMLFNYADNGNYTTTLNYQVAVDYKPNGSGTTRTAYLKNMGWHFARYGGVAYPDDPLYCIEPWRSFGASTSGNSVDRDVTLNGSGSTSGSNVWYALPAERREAIGLILLYSNQMWDHSISVSTTSKDNNPNVPLRIATQFLIFEIVCGLRDPVAFTTNSTNECGTDGNVFYEAGEASVPYFAPNYNAIVNSVQAAMKIPSFTSKTSGSAPTITLTGEETSIYDSNGVLSNFSFSDGNGAEFYKSGDTLYITQTGNISDSTVFKATRNVPSASGSTYNIWYMSGSSYQTTISLANPSSGGLSAYFKLKGVPATGNISLTKTTEDGKNLSGWRFGVYSNSACTSLVSGPHTTNSSGKISVTGLSAGTYYVKELGHSDSGINALYTCASTNPQRVAVSSGGTATVSFYNKLQTGAVKLVKATNTGKNTSGWKIGLYTDSRCTSQVSGSPFTTGSDGTVTVSGLKPGTYYAKEVSSADSYWVCDTEIKTVQVEVNKTTSVTFTNVHYGRIEFHKTTNTGNHLGGWIFQVWNADGDVVGEYTTDEAGYACTENLLPGRHTVQELPTDDLYWTVELGYHTVTVEAGRNAVDQWHNKEQGLGWFYKKTNTGENVEGWNITVYSDESCTQKVCSVTTNQEGKVGYYLDPGTYWAKETGDEHGRFENEYWMVDQSVQKFEIKPHEDTTVTFENVHCGQLKIIKSMDGEGSLSGWQFRITDSSGAEIAGSPFTTDESGLILTGMLQPGEYKAEELIPENSLYYCTTENPQTVTVKPGETAQVSFTNALRPGKITIEKVDIQGEPLAGATFLLEWSEDGSLWWSVEYTDSGIVTKGYCSNPNIEDGCLTSGEDGLLEWVGLHPGLMYRVTELEAPDGYSLLTEAAFEGTLPADDLTVSFRVVNCESFKLPQTGSGSAAFLRITRLLCVILCVILLTVSYRKERRK